MESARVGHLQLAAAAEPRGDDAAVVARPLERGVGGAAAGMDLDAVELVFGAAIARIRRDDLPSASLERCILRAASSWVFPLADAPTEIESYPLRFGAVSPDAGK